jgi:uncharacterized protein YggE
MRTSRLIAAFAAVLVVAAAVAAGALVAGATAADPSEGEAGPSQVVVSGTGEELVQDDSAAFTFGVTARRSERGAALRAASRGLRRVVDALRDAGVAEDGLRTEAVRLGRTRGRDEPDGFVARTAVRATVRDLGRAGEIVDRAVRAGATNVDGPTYEASGLEEARRRALAKAYAAARDKAERLARAAGMPLGAPLRIREESGPVPFADEELRSGAAQAGQGPPVVSGRREVRARVGVAFRLG